MSPQLPVGWVGNPNRLGLVALTGGILPRLLEIDYDGLLHQLEALANQEGAAAAELIRRLAEADLNGSQAVAQRRYYVRLPLIPVTETGPVKAVTGADVDEILARDLLNT